jgi:hypothetical protein
MEIIELTRHFGSVVGTPGISEELAKLCNTQLLRLTETLVKKVDEALLKNSNLIL